MATPTTVDFQQSVAILSKQEGKFTQLALEAKTDAQFRNELLFASQALMGNDYLCSAALRNPLSFRTAFHQIATSGLTLNPARGWAYLVPRDGRVVLDVSYRGMIRVAVTDGAIKDCIVELVYSKDEFIYKGKRQTPTHSFNPFDKTADRGELVGAYVEALLPDGRILIETVTADEIYSARDASDLWKRKKKGPWLDHFIPMAKKSAIKIARKYWPQSGLGLDEVIQYLNTNGGEGYASPDNVPIPTIERVIGLSESSPEDIEPLPTSNKVSFTEPDVEVEVIEAASVSVPLEPETQHEITPAMPEPVIASPESQATQVIEGAVLLEENIQPVASELPEKVVKKVADLVQRATLQGCWDAAREYVNPWPEKARLFAINQLKAAEYAAARE